jgi:hypothetical protein
LFPGAFTARFLKNNEKPLFRLVRSEGNPPQPGIPNALRIRNHAVDTLRLAVHRIFHSTAINHRFLENLLETWLEFSAGFPAGLLLRRLGHRN